MSGSGARKAGCLKSSDVDAQGELLGPRHCIASEEKATSAQEQRPPVDTGDVFGQ